MKNSSLLILLLLSFCISCTLLTNVRVNAASPSVFTSDITVNYINHTVEVFDGGLVVLNNTLSVTGNTSSPPEFLVGFPFTYGSHLERCFAYETGELETQLVVKHDFGLGKIGFHGVNVLLGKELNLGETYNFTVIFIFSGLVTSETKITNATTGQYEVWYNLQFPLYPSIIQNASVCDVQVILPNGMLLGLPSVFVDLRLNITTPESRIVKHQKTLLEEYRMEEGYMAFTAQVEGGYKFNIFDIQEVERKVNVRHDTVAIADSYRLVSLSHLNVSDLYVYLPLNVTDVTVEDVFGRITTFNPDRHLLTDEEKTLAIIPLRNKVNIGGSAWFTVKYSIPLSIYVRQLDWNGYTLELKPLEYSNWLIRKLTISISLIEGGEFTSFSEIPEGVTKDMFVETVTLTFNTFTRYEDNLLVILYSYFPLWASLRPTLWVGVLLAIASAVVLTYNTARKSVMPSVVHVAPIGADVLRSFVKDYEEKRKVTYELKSLERQVRRGKISRRRYKLRRKTLENRLTLLGKSVSGVSKKISAAGAKYADFIRQLEIAETELEGVEADIKRVAARYKRGELSAGAYRKLVSSYNQRKDKATTVIDGILLRLREGIS